MKALFGRTVKAFKKYDAGVGDAKWRGIFTKVMVHGMLDVCCQILAGRLVPLQFIFDRRCCRGRVPRSRTA